MSKTLEKRYGLWTAVSMVVGIVIGSGVFFKAEKILSATGGDLGMGIVAWLVGGAIMISCGYVFALLAGKYEKVNGIVDYAEAAFGSTYGYLVGWFMAIIYYPTLTAVLAWVSARYTSVLLGFADPIAGAETYVIAIFYLVAIYAMNVLSPKLAGRFQVSTTIIKLIPLGLVAIVGIISGLSSGQTITNFTQVMAGDAVANPLLTSIVATAFAYEGWIVATSLNSEIKDSKKNLPKALLMGTTIVVVVYVLYFIGINGALPVADLMKGGEEAVKLAYSTLLGNAAGSLLFVFVVISCIGTLNGVMLGCSRGLYSLAARNMGPNSEIMSQVDEKTGMPGNSAVAGLFLVGIWLTVWFGNFAGWWPMFFDISELPIVTMYALYIPIFVWTMRSMKDFNLFNRIIMPALAIAGSMFMIYAAFSSHGVWAVSIYLILFSILMVVGLIFKNPKKISQK